MHLVLNSILILLVLLGFLTFSDNSSDLEWELSFPFLFRASWEKNYRFLGVEDLGQTGLHQIVGPGKQIVGKFN